MKTLPSPSLPTSSLNSSYVSYFLKSLDEVLEALIAEENLTVESICKKLGISRMQLHRKLKKKASCCITTYTRNYRLKKARHLLLTTVLGITQIAFEVGFQDANYFTRSFKNNYGMTPREFRKDQER